MPEIVHETEIPSPGCVFLGRDYGLDHDSCSGQDARPMLGSACSWLGTLHKSRSDDGKREKLSQTTL